MPWGLCYSIIIFRTNTRLRLLFIKIKSRSKNKPAAKSKIRRHLCPNKKALSDQGLL